MVAIFSSDGRVAGVRVVSFLRTRMDKSEAQKVLSEQLARFSQLSYVNLVRLVESSHVDDFEVPGPSGAKYGVEIQFFWDDKSRDFIRIVGSIDDGGIRALMPLTQTVLVSRQSGIVIQASRSPSR